MTTPNPVLRLTFPDEKTLDYVVLFIKGVKLNGKRPTKMEILVEVSDEVKKKIVENAQYILHPHIGNVYYLGEKIWSRK